MGASEAILMEGLPSRKHRALLDGLVASRAFAFNCCDKILPNKIETSNSSLITHQGRFSLPLDLGLQSWGTQEVCRSDCPVSSPSLPPSCSQPGWKIIVSSSSSLSLVSYPSRWSFSFILGPLHWSSSWQWQPSMAGCRLFQTLLWTQLADFAQFFCKMYLLYMWPSRKTCLVWFGGVLPP